ncbi:MAG: tetratricopeptide repeat protein, partial [Alphaproteobacteria bacterium]|nr:tetratricopeptide repeat protein [Alphaproteobacteria bacterium]
MLTSAAPPEDRIAALAAIVEADLAAGRTPPRDVCLDLCTGLYQRRDHAAALGWLDRIVPHHPDDVQIANLRGVVLRNLGRLDEALAELTRAGTLDPDNPLWRVNAGNIHLERADGPAAVAMFEQAVAMAPDDGRLRHLLGAGHYFSGQPDRALACFEAATRLAPEDRK